MNLNQQEISIFYKLWYGLVWGINEKHKIIPHFKRPIYGTRVAVSIEEFMKVRNAMWSNPKWIDEFLASYDNGEFTEQERGIITDWRNHFVKGKFVIMKHLAKYSVIMTFEGMPTLLYGVHGISDSVKVALPYPIPFPVELVLLPFNDKIIYDSIAASFNISFGSGMRSASKEWYDEAKEKYGIIEVLNGKAPVIKIPTEKPKKQSAKAENKGISDTTPVPKGVNVPKTMAAKYNEVAEIIAKFADEKLNEEYKDILLRALAKLCRKRQSPLEKGKARTWACGIVYAIGSNNFIFDKSQPINMTANEIAEWFGLSKSTAGSKASEVATAIDLSYMNSEFSLSSIIEQNPAIWNLQVNGFLVDVRRMPREIQEAAFKKGLIPYIPADRE